MSIKVRRRSYLIAAVIATISIGILSRKYSSMFPSVLGKYPGDAFWAQTVYWTLAFIFPSASVGKLASCALAVSYADEMSQLYHAHWIDQIRATTVGHLFLGSKFSWIDLLAYTIGIALCTAIESLLIRFRSRSSS
jgi:hypothetical protein